MVMSTNLHRKPVAHKKYITSVATGDVLVDGELFKVGNLPNSDKFAGIVEALVQFGIDGGLVSAPAERLILQRREKVDLYLDRADGVAHTKISMLSS